MYNSIVVGIDGSPTAEIALERAIELACVSGARLHVVSAYEPVPAHVSGAPAGEDFQAPSDFKADAVLQRALDRVATRKLEIEQHAPKGGAADALIGVAEDRGADLIVIGSVGMHGPKRIFGSVPNRVSHRSPCDVLIVQTSERQG
jgi:nucleotide-binding universal stress UspA family protein